MFEVEAYMEVKRIIYQLDKAGEWDSLAPEMQNVYTNNLKYWNRRLGNPNGDAGNQDNDTLSMNGNRQAKKPDRKKYYDHPFSLEKAEDELGFIPADPFSVEDYIIEQETYQELQGAIGTLDETDQNIINLYYFEGLSEAQVGETINMKQRTVSSHKRNSLEKMKKFLTKKQ